MTRVLVVEDDPTAGPAVARILRAEGFTVHVLEAAEDALRYLRSVPCDLLIADVRLEGMSGAEMVKALRRGASAVQHIPVILLSALPADEIAELAASCSQLPRRPGEPEWTAPTAWLEKPVSTAALVVAIEELLRTSVLPGSVRSSRRGAGE